MITAVDSNVLFDLILDDVSHADGSEAALLQALSERRCVVSEMVYAELSARFSDAHDLDRFLSTVGLQLDPSPPEVWATAGRAWRAYTARRPRQHVCAVCGSQFAATCLECGAVLQTRQHLLADFLIGAHATHRADRLLTRDKGVFDRYFDDLQTLAP